MFARISTFTLLALPILATATAILPRTDGASCATGTTQCCQSVQSPTSTIAQILSGLLGVSLGSITGDIGLTCSPITAIGLGGNQCTTQPVCCSNNNFNGLVALGCNPINIGL